MMLRALSGRNVYSVIPALKRLANFRTFNNNSKNILSYNDEVLTAKKNHVPIVALESAIITNGMPYPDNLETALEVEDIIREQGAVPATIGILDGKVYVGIDQVGLERLASPERIDTVKCSRRDFPFVIANRLNGGTTVSGTILVANLADIPIMATGGIGGVHRFAESTFDISADLIELGRTPVAVVCAGIKAILDIPRTLEYLETQGVPVITIGENNIFPAFYCRETVEKVKSPYQVTSPKDAANLIKAQRKLALAGGMLLAVPIPHEHSLDPQQVEIAIQEALKNAGLNNIRGKDTTPFLLQRMNEITAGRSLSSNKALIKNNARVAAVIAVNLSIDKNISNGDKTVESKSGRQKSGPVVIGGAILDTVVQLAEPTIKFDGGTHNGTSRESCGGVGRNVAAALINLGVKGTRLLSVVGDDRPGQILIKSLRGGDSMVEVNKDVYTARYVVLVDCGGECQFGVGEMTAHQAISPKLVRKYQSQLENATILVLDGNPPSESILEVFNIADQFQIPVWYEPTDVRKATKVFENNEHWKKWLHFISPNRNELLAIARHLGISVPNDHHNLDLDTIKDMAEQLANYVPVVLTTLGSQGVLVSRKATDQEQFYDRNGHLIGHANLPVQTRLYPPFSVSSGSQDRVVSVSGCGDCLAAGVIYGIQEGMNEASCMRLALKAASLSLIYKDYHLTISKVSELYGTAVTMSRILRAYQSLLKNYPTSVHAVQTGTLMGIGDQLAQNLVERREIKHLDFARTAQFAGIGFFVAGPVLHTWYGFLHRRIGSGSSKLALKKVLVDQTFFPPPFLASLLILVSSARGNNIEEIKQKLKNNYPDILINNYKLWPMVQLVNFYFVRLEYQALVVQVVALLWNTYFSYSANRDVQPDHKSAVVQTPVKRDMES